MRLIALWKAFIDSLDSPGGYIIVCALLMGAGGWLLHSNIAEGGSILTGAYGALLGMMNAKRKDSPAPASTEGAK